MLIVMDSVATAEDIRRVVEAVQSHGLQAHPIPGAQRTAIGITGNRGSVDPGAFENLPGVLEVIPVSAPYKLVSREAKRENTVVSVGDVDVGGERIVIVGGPCAVESEEQAVEIGRRVRAAGGTLYRGGAFKPRTSPYAFQGLGVEALRYLAEARDETGLPVVTEVMEPQQVDIVAEYADILQIGARNMQNYSLLNAAGRVARPVMVKRGFGATIEELLMAAEYIVAAGNPNVILCERGIRTFETYTRNTMDLAAVPVLHSLTHLPVIVDPSHATGKRWLVKPLALGGVAVGADGVMVEVHPNPDDALSDAEQQLTLDQFRDMMAAITPLHAFIRGVYAAERAAAP